MANNTPPCYKCEYRGSIPGDCHSQCRNLTAEVKLDSHGVKNGWAWWPLNFDPIWVNECKGFKEKS